MVVAVPGCTLVFAAVRVPVGAGPTQPTVTEEQLVAGALTASTFMVYVPLAVNVQMLVLPAPPRQTTGNDGVHVNGGVAKPESVAVYVTGTPAKGLLLETVHEEIDPPPPLATVTAVHGPQLLTSLVSVIVPASPALFLSAQPLTNHVPLVGNV